MREGSFTYRVKKPLKIVEHADLHICMLMHVYVSASQHFESFTSIHMDESQVLLSLNGRSQAFKKCPKMCV